jgi:hypothetical protein
LSFFFPLYFPHSSFFSSSSAILPCLFNFLIFLLLLLSCLSFLGSSLVILSYLFVKELRRFPYNLVFYLALSDFCFTMRFVMLLVTEQETSFSPSPSSSSSSSVSSSTLSSLFSTLFPSFSLDETPSSLISSSSVSSSLSSLCSTIQQFPRLCFLQAIWSQFWGLASISWNGIISINLVLDLSNPFGNNSIWQKWYHLYVWGLSTATTLAMVIGFSKSCAAEDGDGVGWIQNRY